MQEEHIAEVGIDDEGRLYVKPSTMSFEHVYRAGKQVNWDPSHRWLFSPVPRDWSYADWFNEIAAAVADEYRTEIRVGLATVWSNVPSSVRAEIGSLAQSG